MRALLALLLALAGAAPAATVTISAPTCLGFEATPDASGNVMLACKAAIPIPPIPVPPIPPSGTCPALPPGVTMVTPAAQSLAKELIAPGNVGQAAIFSLPLPHMPAGTLSTTRQPSTPPSMQMRIFVSKCPGDMAYANANPYYYSWDPGHSFPYYPCMAPGSAESAAIWWGATAAQNTCAVAAGTTWYVNMQTSDATGANTCTTPSGCAFIFWWNPN